MSTYIGPWDWGMSRDREGHRTYELFSLIKANNTLGSSPTLDDPSVIINTAGLPAIGSLWSDLTFIRGSDDWAWCLPDVEVTPHESEPGEPVEYWLVKNTFATTPFSRCQDATIENPLNEPHELSGSWVNKKVIPHVDRDGLPYRSFTGEPLFGSETERDDSDWELVIGFNSADIPISTVNSLRHRLNDSTMWGLAAEKIKFSKYSFTRRVYGTCSFYYHNVMHFSIRDSWTQNLADKGRMKLKAGGTATNPDDWVRAKDDFGENRPLMRLDTNGDPIVSDSQTPNTIVREPYSTGNLFLLGVPTVL